MHCHCFVIRSPDSKEQFRQSYFQPARYVRIYYIYIYICNSYTMAVKVVWDISRDAQGRSLRDESDKSHTSPRPPWDSYVIAHPWQLSASLVQWLRPCLVLAKTYPSGIAVKSANKRAKYLPPL